MSTESDYRVEDETMTLSYSTNETAFPLDRSDARDSVSDGPLRVRRSGR
ncbi:MAG: hypothetical protein V5A34_04560 [Halapricum sp.]